MLNDITLLLSILIAGLSGLLFVVSIAAYKKIGSQKLLLISIAFFVFLIKGILLIFEIATQDEKLIIIDFAIIAILYFATAKK
jgi:hypothetical protein